jgi:lipopolysaccharide export system protein LptA
MDKRQSPLLRPTTKHHHLKQLDKIYYNRKKSLGRAWKNVRITDTTEAVVLTGEFADYNEKTGQILITEKAVMEKAFGKDTLFLHGDTLRSVLDSVTDKRTLYAYYKVKFFKRDFQGKCDSLTYSESDSLMRLFRNPVIWNEENQLTADTVRIQLANNQLIYLLNIHSFWTPYCFFQNP